MITGIRPTTILDRLERKKVLTKDGCWLFIGSHSRGGQGPGQIRYLGKLVSIPRLSAHLSLGLDLSDAKQQANHKQVCPDSNCWNPDHLYVGTQQDNIRDAVVRKEYGQRLNTRAKKKLFRKKMYQ